ncbi:MAG: AraC family transcriptional regulator [Phycisphaerales bacterium]|jgi:AraC-like DNA-binding protein|nr:AraC family transcriptional regulator [Phycisphaerales bacterium]
MTKSNVASTSAEISNLIKSAKGESLPYRQIFDAIEKAIPSAQVLMTSTLPRGGTQIVQPSNCPEIIVKGYNRDLHVEDRLTWQTIVSGKPVRGLTAWGSGEYESSRYVQELLEPAGLRYAAAAPLKAPVLSGYPGALHLYRKLGDQPFTDAELEQLAEFAAQLDEGIEDVRQQRHPSEAEETPWSHYGAVRQLALDAKGKQHLPVNGHPLDQRLMQQIQQHAQHRLAHLGDEAIPADRLQLPDSRGDLWIFRAITFNEYPSLGEGPFVFFCLQPEAWEWDAVRISDVQADPEMSRLIPAVKFMHDEFGRSPTLDEIAAKAHLSPFHFHRRFTDLLGQTPKHFLLACQIHRAKQLLVERKKELAEIAKECGFAHQSHFTSRFKQATGLTPTRWRRLAADLAKAARD